MTDFCEFFALGFELSHFVAAAVVECCCYWAAAAAAAVVASDVSKRRYCFR